MPDVDFRVDGAEPVAYAVVPTLAFKLRLTALPAIGEDTAADIQGIALNCQIRLEPARRRYSPHEQQHLHDIFGEPHRWAQTVRPMLWAHAPTNVPPFTGSTTVDLPVPCTFDFNIATTKYFHALEDGQIPLSFLFSGSVFYTADDGSLRLTQISWEKEASFQLPVSTWKALMNAYYPNTAWLRLQTDAFDRLAQFKSRRALPTWERAIETLLDQAEEPVTP